MKKLRFPAATGKFFYTAVAIALGILQPLAVWAGPVDINTADAKTLARELQGIGLARAQAIVAYREKNGPFKSAEDLKKIKGVGAHVIELNRSNIQLGKGQLGKGEARKGASAGGG